MGRKILLLSVLFSFSALFLTSIVAAATLVKNANGTVSDNENRLVWQQTDNNTTYKWKEAVSYCEKLTLAGFKDWRLPKIRELKTIVNENEYDPTIDKTFFPNTKSTYYWSSTVDAHDNRRAWRVNFYHGFIDYYSQGSDYYVRCVRTLEIK